MVITSTEVHFFQLLFLDLAYELLYFSLLSWEILDLWSLYEFVCFFTTYPATKLIVLHLRRSSFGLCLAG